MSGNPHFNLSLKNVVADKSLNYQSLSGTLSFLILVVVMLKSCNRGEVVKPKNSFLLNFLPLH